MRLMGFGNGAAHFDELVYHAPVNFQINRHTSSAQLVGVFNPFVHQRVTFGQTEPGGCHALHLGCVERRKTPVVAVGLGADVVVEKVADVRLFQQKTVGKCFVR